MKDNFHEHLSSSICRLIELKMKLQEVFWFKKVISIPPIQEFKPRDTYYNDNYQTFFDLVVNPLGDSSISTKDTLQLRGVVTTRGYKGRDLPNFVDKFLSINVKDFLCIIKFLTQNTQNGLTITKDSQNTQHSDINVFCVDMSELQLEYSRVFVQVYFIENVWLYDAYLPEEYDLIKRTNTFFLEN